MLLLLPVLMLSMLPSILFQGDGENLLLHPEEMPQQLEELYQLVEQAMEAGRQDAFTRIRLHFAAWGEEDMRMEIENPEEEALVSPQQVLCLYCAAREETGEEVSPENLAQLLADHVSLLWTIDYWEAQYQVEVPVPQEPTEENPSPAPTTALEWRTLRTYRLVPRTEDELGEDVFSLTPEGLAAAHAYEENLELLLQELPQETVPAAPEDQEGGGTGQIPNRTPLP